MPLILLGCFRRFGGVCRFGASIGMLLVLLSAWAPGVAFAQSPPARAGAAAIPPATLRFDILEFVVEGDTLLGSEAIERVLYPFLGEDKSVQDAENARRALDKAYQDAGFLSVSVQLPPQQVQGGELRLVVQPAPVGRLRVTGAEYHLPSQVRQAVPSVAAGAVPNFNELQQELTQLSTTRPDLQVTPILAAGTQPGTLDVELKVQDELPLHGSVELNDSQAVDTKRGRLQAALRYDNLFQLGHSVGLNWFTAPTELSQADVRTLSYNLPLGGLGDRLYLQVTQSDSDTPTPLGGVSLSRGETWRLRWRDELAAPESIRHALSWGMEYQYLRGSTRLRYTTLGLGYEITLLQPAADGQTRQSQLQGDWTVSLPGLSRRTVDCGGVAADQFVCSREAAQARFQTLKASISHREPLGLLGPAWLRGWWLFTRVQGQYTDTPLVSPEQVAYGGADTVRGYYDGEQTGDLGLALRLELSSPSWQVLSGAGLSLLAFHDRARLRTLFAVNQREQSTKQLGSSGLGLRLQTRFGLEAALDWAWVHDDTSRFVNGVVQPLSGTAAEREQRWGLSVRQEF
jgi:hemolysin activation/secretion protein